MDIIFTPAIQRHIANPRCRLCTITQYWTCACQRSRYSSRSPSPFFSSLTITLVPHEEIKNIRKFCNDYGMKRKHGITKNEKLRVWFYQTLKIGLAGAQGFEPYGTWFWRPLLYQLSYTPTRYVFHGSPVKQSTGGRRSRSKKIKWRRRWDSNPCGPIFPNPNGLANRPLQPLEYFSRLNLRIITYCGGEGGIRTHGPFRNHWFSRPASLNHSDTSPYMSCTTIQRYLFCLKMVTHRRFELRTP